MFPGGMANKLGNEYERKWAVRKFLEVLQGNANAIQYEGVSEDFRGFEFALHRPNCVEWHQTKINATHGNWTLNALNQQGVIAAFKLRLSTDAEARCVFVSQDSAKPMRQLCEKARMTNGAQELQEATSIEERKKFNKLTEIWSIDEGTAFEWLRRCSFRTESREAIEEAIEMLGRHLLCGDGELYAILSNYLIENLNTPIETEDARKWIREVSQFSFRAASLDPTLREQVEAANLRYLQSYTPFGVAGKCIARVEADNVLDGLQAESGPSLILLTGETGSGKSGIVRQVMDGLATRNVPHLAFRIDRHLSCQTRKGTGSVLLDRDESPVSVLANLAPDERSVLIVDQIDAVSEVSGRSGAVKDVLFELVRETGLHGDVRCLLACRGFDLENDPQYRELERQSNAQRIVVPRLSWEGNVAPLLENAGIAAEGLTDSQRSLLTLPINLSVFLEIDDPELSFATTTALMEKLLQKKTRDLRKDRNVEWNVQKPLSAMADWMSSKQTLSCPDQVLDPFDGARDWLASEGLIVVDQRQLAFFHESFFDFLFARTFAQSNRDILELLTSNEQHLFRRTQVRQILILMRDTDRPAYLAALKAVLTCHGVRVHIKHAVAQWLSMLDDATRAELSVILQIDDGGDVFPLPMRKALFVSETWFDLLSDGNELSNILREAPEPRCRQLLRWLGDVADKRPAPIAGILRRWWDGKPGRADSLVEWFSVLRRMPAERALAVLLRDVLRAAPGNAFQNHRRARIEHLLPNLSGAEPEVSAGILQALFAQWFAHHPNTHPFERHEAQGEVSALAALAEELPNVFLDGAIQALVESVHVARGRSSCDLGLRVLYQTTGQTGSDALFSLYRKSLRRLAEAAPAEAERRLDQLDPGLDKVLLHLHLEKIGANPATLGRRFPALLHEQEVLSAGLRGAEWKSFADAAKAALEAGILTPERVEHRVYRHHPEHENAGKMWRRIKEAGEHSVPSERCKAITELAWSGRVEWCVLKTIGRNLLSPQGKKRLAELERKFPAESVPSPHVVEAQDILLPIPENAICKMSDEQWLSAMRKDWFANGVRQSREGNVFGGPMELAQGLGRRAKSDPERFMRLFLRFPADADALYGQSLLGGLADAEHLDTESGIAVLRKSHDQPGRPFGLQIIRLLTKCPSWAQEDDIFEGLLWYAEHGDAPEGPEFSPEEQIGELPSIDDLVGANVSLISSGINSVRGAAWELLGRLVQRCSDRIPAIWTLIERRAGEEPSTPVRATMLYPLGALFNADESRFGHCLLRLSAPIAGKRDAVDALAPLATHVGIRLFPYIERDLPDIALGLMTRMIGSPNKNLHLIGSWWGLAERLRRGNSSARFPDIQRRSPAHAKLWASLLCRFAVETEYRELAISELEALFSHNIPEVRKQAAEVFGHVSGEDFSHFANMARTFLQSSALRDNAYPLLKAMGKASCGVTELAIQAGEALFEDWGDHYLNYTGELQALLKREYVNSEGQPEFRARILDLIDRMIANGVHEAEDLTELEDR
jgi:hypothetical protein